MYCVLERERSFSLFWSVQQFLLCGNSSQFFDRDGCDSIVRLLPNKEVFHAESDLF